jgi:hypothetical protein
MAAGGGDVYNDQALRAFAHSLLAVLDEGNSIGIASSQDGTGLKIENLIYDYVKRLEFKWGEGKGSVIVDFTAVIGKEEKAFQFAIDLATAQGAGLMGAEQARELERLGDTVKGKPKRTDRRLADLAGFDMNHGEWVLDLPRHNSGSHALNISFAKFTEQDFGKTYTFRRADAQTDAMVLDCYVAKSESGWFAHSSGTVAMRFNFHCVSSVTLTLIGLDTEGFGVFSVDGFFPALKETYSGVLQDGQELRVAAVGWGR